MQHILTGAGEELPLPIAGVARVCPLPCASDMEGNSGTCSWLLNQLQRLLTAALVLVTFWLCTAESPYGFRKSIWPCPCETLLLCGWVTAYSTPRYLLSMFHSQQHPLVGRHSKRAVLCRQEVLHSGPCLSPVIYYYVYFWFLLCSPAHQDLHSHVWILPPTGTLQLRYNLAGLNEPFTVDLDQRNLANGQPHNVNLTRTERDIFIQVSAWKWLMKTSKLLTVTQYLRP